MIFVHFLWPLLVLNGPVSTLETTDTEDASQNYLVEGSEPLQGHEFHEMWSSFGGFQEQDNQKTNPWEWRNSLDDKLDSFGQKPEEGSKLEADWTWLERADAWCRNQKISDDQQEQSASEEKAKEVSDPVSDPSEAKECIPSHLDLELKQMQEKLGDCPVPDDVSENTENNDQSMPQPKSHQQDYETNYKSTKREEKASKQPDSLDRLISGELSMEIVFAVFEAVRKDPELQPLLPILEQNLKPEEQPTKSDQTRKEVKENYLEQMEDIKQKCPSDCKPLPPHLVDFYDLVLKTADEEKKAREKKNNFPDSTKIKKLLPLGDHLDEAEVHDEL